MGSVVIFEDDDLQVLYLPPNLEAGCQGLVYTFTSYLSSPSDKPDELGFGGTFLPRAGFHVIAFRALKNHWYQCVNSETIEKIKQFASSLDPVPVVTSFGSSMGGYGALLFAGDLECNRTLSFVPQYAIDQDFDRRWAGDASKLNFTRRLGYEPMPKNCHHLVVFDPKTDDQKHYIRLENWLGQSVSKIETPFAGHHCARFLHEADSLKDLAACWLSGRNLPEINIRQLRRKSPSYWHILGQTLLERRHFNFANSITGAAIQMHPNHPPLRQLHIECLVAKCDWDSISQLFGSSQNNVTTMGEYIHLAELMVESSGHSTLAPIMHRMINEYPAEPRFWIIYMRSLAALKRDKDVIEIGKKGYLIHPNNSAICALLAGAFIRCNDLDLAIHWSQLALSRETPQRAAWIHSQHITILILMKREEDARLAVAEGLRMCPGNVELISRSNMLNRT